ncbi:hypothetical protein [Streptomyces pseudovenezuelae]|uniref:ABC transporter permease n=1 Tax=Streptomyces pseudovenezuelae TaxID=67350 RepID=A0ABT6LQH0_9ACTN|nr:hypothetical protein [Streptomyces pseudovenezuelae]MDH6218570.1 hypothetical protein [Streptomyces pseudovenezuelae]
MTAARLPRVVLRLHRTALIVWTLFVLGAVAFLVWLNEVEADRVQAQTTLCRHASTYCANVFASLDYSSPMGWISSVVYYSFWGVAAWAGAALIGRELESGTAQLAWTQGVSPTRWLATKLALPALALTVGGTLFVFVFRWGWSAHRDLMGDDWTFNDVFAARGPALVAWSLCALAVGTLTALLLRRSLPALAVSVSVMVVLNRYMEKHRTDLWPNTPTDRSRHPASHFWPMNLIETGILLTIAALSTTAAFWSLRRRTA